MAFEQQPMIGILLATYNGELYLNELLNSILMQSYKNWLLIIHDDGSIDGTISLLEAFCVCYPEKTKLIVDGIINGSALNNFSHLMGVSNFDYIMFCDQDDVWLERKIELSLAAILREEYSVGKNIPLAVFTDAKVVSDDLALICNSIWEYQGTSPRLAYNPKLLAIRNCITGCTMMLNRAAVLACYPIPRWATMHDWWCGLKILEQGGLLIPVLEATVLYRQHNSNVVGAKRKRNLIFKIADFGQLLKNNISAYRMSRRLRVIQSPFEFLFLKVKAVMRC
jgi:glycosyltransferase involved in cell wall biosynthesis